MPITKSFQSAVMPSAILSDGGLLLVPLFAVTAMSLSESFHLPPIGSAGSRASVSSHDDTITLNGLLVGGQRFTWKALLEQMAEASKRGTALESLTSGKVTGLILVTSMTIRTDMQIQSLSFSASSAKRDTLDVNINLMHLPRPGALAKLLDISSIAVGALADLGGN